MESLILFFLPLYLIVVLLIGFCITINQRDREYYAVDFLYRRLANIAVKRNASKEQLQKEAKEALRQYREEHAANYIIKK
jgi:hypothetical protein